MDYRERKYLRQIRDARLRVREIIRETANVKPVIEGLAEQERVAKYDTVKELDKIQVFPQTARKQIRFNSEITSR